jgi:Rrf2 family protein
MVDTRFPVSVHIMTLLAYQSDISLSSTDLAKSLKTNPTFVRRLVGRLVEGGLIQSSRGKGGGLTLARPPKDITLKEIYIASLQDKQLVCLPKKSPKMSCPVSRSMADVLSEIVNGIENSTQKYLAKTTLEDLVNSIRTAFNNEWE